MAIEEIEVQETEGFVIEDDSKADWVLEQIKDFKTEINRKNELADSRIAQIENWKIEETKKIISKIEWFETSLHTYAIKLKEKNPNLKTHSLPFGELQFRKQKSKYIYDDKKLIKFLEDGKYDNLLKIEKKPRKDELKKNIQIIKGKLYLDGVEVEGIEIEERGEKFSIQVVE
jgi:hypothetical protein